MKRSEMIAAMDEPGAVWDVIIIGGGATGLGAAVESSSRGHRTILLESHDFAKGTSSRSTKLIHGGVRYLRKGQIGMVRQSLRERERLFNNAPHLVHPLEFVMPTYSWGKREFYYIGLRLYDMLACNFWTGRARCLSARQVQSELTGLCDAQLKGGVKYIDGQFDDARLAITLARTAAKHEAVVVNYMDVVRLQCEGDRVRGVIARDAFSGREYPIRSRTVINATGVFAEHVLDLESTCQKTSMTGRGTDDPRRPTVRPSQGTHLVLDAEFLPGPNALMIPETDDGRVLFAIPWHGKVLLGTTDVAVPTISREPRPMAEEIQYLLRYAARYLQRKPTEQDIRSCFSGLRPLVGQKSGRTATSKLSREHEIYVGPTGMITVIGGKWTTYRHMGEELINHAETIGELPRRPSQTANLPLHGSPRSEDKVRTGGASTAMPEHLSIYGTDVAQINSLFSRTDPTSQLTRGDLSAQFHPDLPYLNAEILWAARHEMAMTVEDILARRTRSLLLDARASLNAASHVATMLRSEFGQSAEWERQQVHDFRTLAGAYSPQSSE